VPSGSSVAALSTGMVPSPSSRPASAAADVEGPSGFSAAAFSVGSRVSSSSPSLVEWYVQPPALRLIGRLSARRSWAAQRYLPYSSPQVYSSGLCL
jgi:hypothetical protein